MSMEISAQPAVASDVQELVAIFLAAMRESMGLARGYWDAVHEAVQFRDQLALSQTVVLRTGRTIVAFAMIRAIGPRTLEVHTLCVAPDYQRQGIGTRVLRQTIDEATSLGAAVELSVLKVNEAARALYRRLGFTEISETDHHIRMRVTAPTTD